MYDVSAFMQILHETDDSLSPSILRAVYEIRGPGVMEKWVPVFQLLIYPQSM